MTSARSVLLLQKWISMCWRALVLNFCCNAKSKKKKIWTHKTAWLMLASKNWQRSSTTWKPHCASTRHCKIHDALRAETLWRKKLVEAAASVITSMHSARIVSMLWQLFARNMMTPWQKIIALCAAHWRWCARGSYLVKCVSSRLGVSYDAGKCSWGPQCHCGWWKFLTCFASWPAILAHGLSKKLTLSCQCGPKALPNT